MKEDAQSADGHVVLGQIMLETDRFPEALASFEKALELKPELAEANNMYGVCLKSVGRLEDARKAFQKALEFNPLNYGTYASLAELEKFTPEHPQLKAMETIIAEAEDPKKERYMGLHLALGKAYDNLGEYNRLAFKARSRIVREIEAPTTPDTNGARTTLFGTSSPHFKKNIPAEIAPAAPTSQLTGPSNPKAPTRNVSSQPHAAPTASQIAIERRGTPSTSMYNYSLF